MALRGVFSEAGSLLCMGFLLETEAGRTVRLGRCPNVCAGRPLPQVSSDAAPCCETLGTLRRTPDCTGRNAECVHRTDEYRSLLKHPCYKVSDHIF